PIVIAALFPDQVMKAGQEQDVVGQIRRAFHRPELETLTDGQLLERFLARRDESAFELLVQRLGPMVLGVCRRLLVHQQDAEDAFQATFLVLVRKGTSIQPRAKAGNWLYGVACRTARESRRLRPKRRSRD